MLDSNVIIAIVAEKHEHHAPSVALMAEPGDRRFAVAGHSFAEAFATLTRRTTSAVFRWSATEAWATPESVAAATVLVGLTPPQTFDTNRNYARAGGVGARLYDMLIGQVATQYSLQGIVTWNVGHMRSLFPDTPIFDPLSMAKS